MRNPCYEFVAGWCQFRLGMGSPAAYFGVGAAYGLVVLLWYDQTKGERYTLVTGSVSALDEKPKWLHVTGGPLQTSFTDRYEALAAFYKEVNETVRHVEPVTRHPSQELPHA